MTLAVTVQGLSFRRGLVAYEGCDRALPPTFAPSLHVSESCASAFPVPIPATVTCNNLRAIPNLLPSRDSDDAPGDGSNSNSGEGDTPPPSVALRFEPWWTVPPAPDAPAEAVFPRVHVAPRHMRESHMTGRQRVVLAHLRAFYTTLGQLVAQAFLDNRLLDLPLATPFLRACINVARQRCGLHVEEPSDDSERLEADLKDLQEVRGARAATLPCAHPDCVDCVVLCFVLFCFVSCCAVLAG